MSKKHFSKSGLNQITFLHQVTTGSESSKVLPSRISEFLKTPVCHVFTIFPKENIYYNYPVPVLTLYIGWQQVGISLFFISQVQVGSRGAAS